jgi:hypothetical protein
VGGLLFCLLLVWAAGSLVRHYFSNQPADQTKPNQTKPNQTKPNQNHPPTHLPTQNKTQNHHNPRLRSGKARTLFYEKADYHRIFSANGTGFSRAGRYGTNALYTWKTETRPVRRAGGGVDGGVGGEEEGGGGGVQGTMKLYMTVRGRDGVCGLLCFLGGGGWGIGVGWGGL